MRNIRVGAVEAGGTHYRCVIGTVDGDIIDSFCFRTSEPDDTMNTALRYFTEHADSIQSLGIAHFGPVDIDHHSKTFGCVLKTPKADWSAANVLARYRSVLSVPMAFQSDVNAAAVGEGALGAAQGLSNYVYVTVGTGIGGGVVINGALLGHTRHPEIGHMFVRRAQNGDGYVGCCELHKDCLEGLASGPALKGRWGVEGEKLPPNHPAWQLQAHYLASMCVNLTLCYVPERIVLGGGAMQQPFLLGMIRTHFLELMNGYMPHITSATIVDFIVASPMQVNAATRGALILAGRALAED